MDKTAFISSNVSPGDETHEWTPADGETWKVRTLVGSAVHDGDSAGFRLEFGATTLSAFSLLSEPFRDDVDREIVGDGVTKLVLTLHNFGSSSKWFFATIRAVRLCSSGG